ncbi:hypothetical protein N0V88_007315 [Collariella sp. IMI 366227]|nr:hypothetical protein N0V88_007315 [Collariella sp. IMI 366227]
MDAASHAKDRDAASRVPGSERCVKSTILETGAKMTQDFSPIQNICAHLNAFHVYASDPTRVVEANHYCGHLTEDVRQGDKLPLGEPQLMTSITSFDQVKGLEERMTQRDKQFPGTDWRSKKEIRKDLPEPEIHPDADYTWKKS